MIKRRIILAVIMILAVPAVSLCDELKIAVDGVNIPVEWEDNESVKALKKLAPLTVEMSAYGGFEQIGSLGSRAKTLPRNDTPITTRPGDIVLYSGNQIVIFHGSNSWSYTRLGKITGKSQSELSEILDKSGVTLTISAE